MKLPQDIQGIHREGRTDCLMSTGVEPLWFRNVVRRVGRVARRHLPQAACLACNAIPHPAAKLACRAIACR